jgi:hypothetical protein
MNEKWTIMLSKMEDFKIAGTQSLNIRHFIPAAVAAIVGE